MKNSCIMESFASSSASLSISIISEADGFFFPLLILVGSSLSLLNSSICEEVLVRALVHGHGGGLWGQLRLRCPCFLQVKHLPAFMSSAHSSASILLALAWPGVVSIVSGLLIFLLFQAAFHCSGVCSFLRDFESEFPVFMPRAEQTSKYFCWYFCAALVQSSHVQGSVLLMMDMNSPGFKPLLNQLSTIWSWRL